MCECLFLLCIALRADQNEKSPPAIFLPALVLGALDQPVGRYLSREGPELPGGEGGPPVQPLCSSLCVLLPGFPSYSWSVQSLA